MAKLTRTALTQMATEVRLMKKARAALWLVTSGVPTAAMVLLTDCLDVSEFRLFRTRRIWLHGDV